MSVCTCSFRWQSLSRGVRAAKLASVSAGQFFRLSVRSEVMRAMAAQPSSDTLEAFCRLRLVRWRMLDHPAKPFPAASHPDAASDPHMRWTQSHVLCFLRT